MKKNTRWQASHTKRGCVCLCPGHECKGSTVALGDGNTGNALMLRTGWASVGVLALRETSPLCERQANGLIIE